ncbi:MULTISPECIES: EF-P lysine aminoacylase EpmA [unclassified Corallococcus]|uniref:EF-P lysine aminoacylase EpmA n=1 Tax=unclassified Corallococcus TaxID=2685029 RepID=UPI001A8F5A4B|nr:MULTISPECIES: EF-P lysine aminoacylase EpmA [unclassified Corallococcus]MBN9683349.1 EF-P lysine aminoacylase GenX [Corallococcus sp. NCSPR001]WAS85133.1 EF-P lysine aminoacylase EpmA [Corallococcus sp. NCRR]
MPNVNPWRAARGRQGLYSALRRFFASQGYLEVETPLLVPTPGMEPYISAFETPFVPETDLGRARTLYLHTSPEYAMKRLLAQGAGPLFQICKVFRNGEVSQTHNPEFTLLEFYRPHADYHAIMDDLEGALAAAGRAAADAKEGEMGADPAFFTRTPYERVTVRDAVLRATGVDIHVHSDGASLKRAADAVGVHTGSSTSFDDVFFHLFLERVERGLGHERPTFLIEYPASMAALSRLKPGDGRVAERVELYAKGLELANGFSELTDAVEQRARLVEEQELRRKLGRAVYPLDERFLEAVGRMPPSAGIAVGLDRILMLLLGVQRIEDVLLFPAHGFV